MAAGAQVWATSAFGVPLPPAGVTIHVFDGTESPGSSYRPIVCPSDRMNASALEVVRATAGNGRLAPGDEYGCMWSRPQPRLHTSASVIFDMPRTRRWPTIPLFRGGGAGGVVFAPLANCLMCAWAADGGTMGRVCDPIAGLSTHCISGCVSPTMLQLDEHTTPALESDSFWCDGNGVTAEDTHCGGLPWRPQHLIAMLKRSMHPSNNYHGYVIHAGARTPLLGCLDRTYLDRARGIP